MSELGGVLVVQIGTLTVLIERLSYGASTY